MACLICSVAEEKHRLHDSIIIMIPWRKSADNGHLFPIWEEIEENEEIEKIEEIEENRY